MKAFAGPFARLDEESYDAVGDTAEFVALLLPAATATSDLPLPYWSGDAMGGRQGAIIGKSEKVSVVAQ